MIIILQYPTAVLSVFRLHGHGDWPRQHHGNEQITILSETGAACIGPTSMKISALKVCFMGALLHDLSNANQDLNKEAIGLERSGPQAKRFFRLLFFALLLFCSFALLIFCAIDLLHFCTSDLSHWTT
jgi:hypothetical protein